MPSAVKVLTVTRVMVHPSVDLNRYKRNRVVIVKDLVFIRGIFKGVTIENLMKTSHSSKSKFG